MRGGVCDSLLARVFSLTMLIFGEVGFASGMRMSFSLTSGMCMEDEIVDDYVDEVGKVENVVCDVLRKMLDVDDDQVLTTLVQQKISSIVTYEGHSIYKSTLVSQLNGNPLLSKDRLTRVINSIYFNNNDDYLIAASSCTTMLLGLGSDVGVYFKQQTSTMFTSTVKAAQK